MKRFLAISMVGVFGFLVSPAIADAPHKSRSRVVADACHAAYHDLQKEDPVAYGGSSMDYDTNYAYLVAFTQDYCGEEQR